MNNVKTDDEFRFFIKEIESNIKVFRIKLSAHIIKFRSIHLLEWAVIAPFVELHEPTPSIEEIAKEFYIEKVDFLYHVARQLINIGIIQEVTRSEFKVTELGKTLYNKGQIQSDSREIDFPMFYEKEAGEWFVGSNISDESILGIAQVNKELNFSNFIPDCVPEEIINRHAKLTNRIGDNEQVIKNEILNIEEIVVSLKANVFLRASGIEVWVTEHPFGEYHRKLLSETLKLNLLHTGRINSYFEDLFILIEEYTSLPKVQSNNIITPNSRLFLPDIPSRVVDEILKQNPSWLITRDARCFEYLNNCKNKPLIIVYIKRNNNPFTIKYSENNIIIPSSIEIVISDTDLDTKAISEGTLISEKNLSLLNIIEAEGCEVPLYILQKNNNPEKGKELLISVLKKSNSKFKEKLANFYLEPTESAFYDAITDYPLETIIDIRSSKQALNSITELKSKIESFPQGSIQELEIYDKIMEHLFFDDLVEISGNTITQCKNAYFKRLNQLLEKDFNGEIDDSWESILPILERKADRYNALISLKDRLEHSEEKTDFTEICTITGKIVEKYEELILEYINLLPSSSNQAAIEKLLKIVSLYGNNKIESICLSRIKSFMSPKTTEVPSNNLLDMELNISGTPNIKESELYSVVKNHFDSTGFDLLNADLHTKVKKVIKKLNEVSPNFNLDEIIVIYLPDFIEKIDSKNKLNALITNLSELRKITKAIDDEYIIKILVKQENTLLENVSFEDLKIWLCLLSNTKKKLENNVNKKILDSSSERVWNIVYPYIEKDKSLITTVEKDLNDLGLGEQTKNLKKKNKSKAFNNNLKIENHELEKIDIPFEVAKSEESLETASCKLLFCPYHNEISLGFIDVESGKPVLSCAYCKKKIEIHSDKYVFDSNILAKCLFSSLSGTDFFTGKTIIIPETVSDEVNHWKDVTDKRFLHKVAMEEIKKIREARDLGKIIYQVKGKEAFYDELIQKGRADKIIIQDAQKENAIVITSDNDFINSDPDISILFYKNSPPKVNEVVDLIIIKYYRYDGISYYKDYKVVIGGGREKEIGTKIRVKIVSVNNKDHSVFANVIDSQSKDQYFSPTRRI